MLNGRLSLHDIDDVEAFCIRIARPYFPRIDRQDHEDLLSYLIATCWELSTRYKGDGKRFSAGAGTILALRIVEWKRERYGRTRYRFKDRSYDRVPPSFVYVDDPLEQPVRGVAVDVAERSSADLLRVLGTRGREGVREASQVGGGQDGKAAA